ncbi:MAG: TIGR04133 family radical SAM/SPASM protein [Proteobacteria bacterium]|nr:TIGR04133 family radical SAM/SPASM protein [Pseudomonadota bacterium]
MADIPELTAEKREVLDYCRDLHDEWVGKHPLMSLFWECTLRCNLNCRHCGSDCRSSSCVPDMPADDFMRVIDSIKPHIDSRKCMIIMTGGEPLLRDDIEKVGLALYRREFPWGLVTNGMALDEKRMESLLRAGLHSITLSLDGFEADHNYIRRNEDSFRRAVRALDLMIQAPEIVYDVVTCVNQNNIKQLHAFKEFLIERGLKAWRLFTVFPVGRGAQGDFMQLPDDQFRELMDFIKTTREEGRIACSYGCEGFLGGYEMEVRDRPFHCNAGVFIAGIRIDGSISGCTSIRANFDQGNIYKDDFMDVWDNRFQKFRNRDWAKKGKCENCEMFRYCEGNGMHLYNDSEELMLCHYERIYGHTRRCI